MKVNLLEEGYSSRGALHRGERRGPLDHGLEVHGHCNLFRR
jgi:hypothetical protein